MTRKKPAMDPGAKIARHKSDIPCSMRVEGGVLECVIENLSLTGAAVRVPSGAALPGSITMEVKTSEGKDISVLAAPVNKISDDGKYARYGINFVNPPEVDPALLMGKKI